MKSSAELYAEVREYYPDRILAYYADKEGLTRAQAHERWDELLKFLVLCVTSEKVHAPSELVDGAWHAFLMHTVEYEAFCLEQLGRFVHHNPKPEPIQEFLNSLDEVFTAFPGAPVRRHLWMADSRGPTAAGDCDASVCVGVCAEKGCSRVTVLRTEPLPSVIAVGR